MNVMRKQFKTLFLSALAMVLAVGCNSVKDDIDSPDLKGDRVVINLVLPEMADSSISTRAGMEAVAEKRIDDAKVFFVRDGAVLFAVEKLTLGSDNKLSFPLTKQQDALLREDVSSVYVLANAGNLDVSRVKTVQDLNNLRVSSKFNLDNPSVFVMSGVDQNFVLDDNRYSYVTLTRAASKLNFVLDFNPEAFTTNASASSKFVLNSVKVRLKNFNNSTYLYPVNSDRNIANDLASTGMFEMDNIANSGIATSGIMFSLKHTLYTYSSKWTSLNYDAKGLMFDVEVEGYEGNSLKTLTFEVRLSKSGIASDFEIKANKAYTVSARILNKDGISEPIEGDIDISDWEEEDIAGDAYSTKYIYVKNSNKEIVSGKDVETIELPVVLGKENADNTLTISNASIISTDYIIDLKAASIYDRTKLTNNKLRRAVEYIYSDSRTVKPTEYVIPGTQEVIPIIRKELAEREEVKVDFIGKGRDRKIILKSKKPLYFLDKVITFDIVDRVNDLKKTVRIVHKDVHTLSTEYSMTSGAIPLVPQPTWNTIFQYGKELVPQAWDILETLVYGKKDENNFERYGVLTVQTNVDDLKYASVRVPSQEMKTISIPVLLTGFDIAKIFDPLNIITYRQNVVAPTQENRASVSPKFMVGSKSSTLKYINIQQAQAHCNTYWELVKDPLTGEIVRYNNFRLPTAAELDLILSLEKDTNTGFRKSILDESLGFKFLGIAHNKESNYWAAHSLVQVDVDSSQANWRFRIKEIISDILKIGYARCVRDVPTK